MGRLIIPRDVSVRRHHVARPLKSAVCSRFHRPARCVFESANQFVANVFAADDVEIEVDAIVEIRQQIEDFTVQRDVVQPLHIADAKHRDQRCLHHFKTRTGHVKNEIDRRDDHEHARDLVEQDRLSSRIVRCVRMIEERLLTE